MAPANQLAAVIFVPEVKRSMVSSNSEIGKPANAIEYATCSWGRYLKLFG
jgi:hypothetical protein